MCLVLNYFIYYLFISTKANYQSKINFAFTTFDRKNPNDGE